MAVIVPKRIVTLAGRNYFANVLGGKISPLSSGLTYFQVGNGGFTIVGGNKVPKEPDENIVALEGPFIFQKNFDVLDLSVSTRFLQVNAIVLEGEANDDGTGNSPELFEIGLFSDTNVLVVYGTFPGLIKTSAFRVTFKFKISF